MDAFQRVSLRYAQITAGCGLYALGFCWFYAPNQICMGGFTGLAQVISFLVPQIPIGMQVLVMNLPLFFLIWKKVGRDWLIASLYAMLASSVFIDLLNQWIIFRPMDPVLASIYGALFVGIGCGLMLRQNATVGGTNLAARLLRLPDGWSDCNPVRHYLPGPNPLPVCSRFSIFYFSNYGSGRIRRQSV